MKNILYIAMVALFAAACSEKDDTWDAYSNWAERNATWYEQVADSARTAILQAQTLYGTDWQEHCEWRMVQSTTIQPDMHGPVTDSICLRYISKAEDQTDSPLWTDSVRVNYRGYLMTTTDRVDGEERSVTTVFDQSFYGSYNPATAHPQLFLVSGTVAGFATALQYMHSGDEVMVYIPQQLGYGTKVQNTIPAYSTLRFHIALVAIYHADEKVPDWN